MKKSVEITTSSQALVDIVKERKSQIKKGFNPAHDDEHDLGELSMFGWEILYHLSNLSQIGCSPENREWIEVRAESIAREHDLRTALIKAAACIVADVERMDRAGIECNPRGDPERQCDGCGKMSRDTREWTGSRDSTRCLCPDCWDNR